MEKEHRKIVLSWCLYDWANSAFATTFMAAVLPFFLQLRGRSQPFPDDCQQLLGVYQYHCHAPRCLFRALLGALADHRGMKKKFLAGFAFLGISSASLLVPVGKGDWFLASLLYIMGMVGFSGGNNFYDSLLPHVAKEGEIDHISSLGVRLGYLGGGRALGLEPGHDHEARIFWDRRRGVGGKIFIPDRGGLVGLFSLPLLKNVPEPPVVPIAGESPHPLRASIQRLSLTFHNLGKTVRLSNFWWLSGFITTASERSSAWR